MTRKTKTPTGYGRRSADPTRQRLVDLILASGEYHRNRARTRDVPITRQGIAKHLAVLERAGLVETEPRRA